MGSRLLLLTRPLAGEGDRPGSARVVEGAQGGYRRAGGGIEALAAGFQKLDDLAAHAGVPEAAEVILDAGGGGRLALGVEELADLVGHIDQAGGVHGRRYSAGAAAIRRLRRLTASALSCQGEGPLEGETSTAVTLYSGQLVAQSEYSVVTTFAWVEGWWKVV